MLLIGAVLMIAAGLAFSITGNFAYWSLPAQSASSARAATRSARSCRLEQAALSQVVPDRDRTDVFAWYTLGGALATAIGALAAGTLTQALQRTTTPLTSYRVIVVMYACAGIALAIIFAALTQAAEVPRRIEQAAKPTPFKGLAGLGRSQSVVLKLSALFALDSFGGGFVIQVSRPTGSTCDSAWNHARSVRCFSGRTSSPVCLLWLRHESPAASGC
jgi:small-conductance mechanosensitive channel